MNHGKAFCFMPSIETSFILGVHAVTPPPLLFWRYQCFHSPPTFLSFFPSCLSLEVLQTFLQEIAAVAPTLPFYYYHLPAVTGVKGSSHLILVPFCSHVQSHLWRAYLAVIPSWWRDTFLPPVPAREVLQNIEKLIPSFSGVKFSGSDLLDFGQCVSCSPPHWSLLYGVDEVSFSSFFVLCVSLMCFDVM